MTTLTELQEELVPFQKNNFPNRENWEPLVGLTEEVGELSHAFLKAHQNIRGTKDEYRIEAMDAVGDILIFLADFCNAAGYDMQRCLDNTWAVVRHRTWVAIPDIADLPSD